MKIPYRSREAATLAEVLISVVLVSLFFAGIFQVNAVCLRYVEATKETVSAIQAVNDRLETLRNIAFSDLLTASYMTTTTGTDTAGNPLPGNGTPAPGLLASTADSSSFAKTVTELVTLTDYTAGSPGALAVTYTRNPGSSSTPTARWTGGTSFPANTTMVKANVTVNWNATFGRRARTEQSETIIAAGVKK